MKTRHNYKRFTIIGLGHLLYAAFNWVFDHVIYVYAVFTWGMLMGGGLMTLLSLIQCALTLQLYEKMQIDWIGGGTLHNFTAQQPTNLTGRLLCRISKQPKAVFLFLCVISDPFITTAYFRKGRFNGITTQDWQVFICSVIVSNGYWICISAFFGNLIAMLWHWLSTQNLNIFFKFLVETMSLAKAL
ncbi:conserved membrane hypothetical protein [Crenothrix polyspora]|uniref:Uncharacterized protein n=1 Tax=Crenothrix polyspora TaxID=360316 RepID=A0A1R4HHZ4_9GAMM|nr:hypothetical protein [Crenothrix polyspora]SJM95854.1 conserved membrane hypothetical protein [Crenothrix polyspora]